jgi:hypothetical protein
LKSLIVDIETPRRASHYPQAGSSVLSYHGNLNRWTLDGDYADLQSVGRGQEFVLDSKDYPEALDWAKDLIAENRA